MSHKGVKQECLTRALRNSVKQGCPTRVSPQCVNSGCLTSEFAGNVTNKKCLCLSTYVSAFGFVGLILFFFGGKRQKTTIQGNSQTNMNKTATDPLHSVQVSDIFALGVVQDSLEKGECLNNKKQCAIVCRLTAWCSVRYRWTCWRFTPENQLWKDWEHRNHLSGLSQPTVHKHFPLLAFFSLYLWVKKTILQVYESL